MPFFTPPTVSEGSPGAHRLFRDIPVPRGTSILKTGNTYRGVRYPTLEEVLAADFVYMGGYEYEITEEEEAALFAAGFGPIPYLGTEAIESAEAMGTPTLSVLAAPVGAQSIQVAGTLGSGWPSYADGFAEGTVIYDAIGIPTITAA